MESLTQFELRKKDHIRLALDKNNQASGAGFNRVHLEHDPLPELNFNEIDISTNFKGEDLSSPFFVSSMTAGHKDSEKLNYTMAKACAKKNWAFAVGSQRKELVYDEAKTEWAPIISEFPELVTFGNIGISQLIQSQIKDMEALVESINARALFVHLNPLQECFQPEGETQFKGGLAAIKNLANNLSVPVVVKETGCGVGPRLIEKLMNSGIFALDVSGFGGTHWGRIEGGRTEDGITKSTAETFKDWGIHTVRSLEFAKSISPDYQIWSSGGIRSGLDGAKSLSMGASMVGIAKPILEAALLGEESLLKYMDQIDYELKVALFCTGSQNLISIKDRYFYD
ncbi:type 2 isopentenyl-diphosphate Delta-isomerase [bacterium]|nr:type 2 isopentenyl-diphosphate Delta-isomerase [bacterium]